MRLSSPDKTFIVNYAPIFAGLNFFEKILIIQKSKVVEFNKGDIIYKQQDAPDAFYCVISGRVRIFTCIQEKEETLEYLNCGKYFGIISLLTGEPHSVSAQAANDSRILKIDLKDFKMILRKIPKLAIDLSNTLSRRLRKKDLVEKKVFESNIVSIFSAVPGIGRTMYALNLSLSLKKETNKNIIFIEVGKSSLIYPYPSLKLGSSFFLDETIKNAIHEDAAARINVLSVEYDQPEGFYTRRLNTLLTYLTGDYHYIIVDLPAISDRVVFGILSQSDIIHIITDYDAHNLKETKGLVSDLFQKVNYPQEKIKIIINARKEERYLSFDELFKALNYKIYANLPLFGEADEKLVNKAILEHPEAKYSKAVGKIARELGDVRVGLALSAGSALGLAHIGVLKILERENIPVDIVVGSSIGALIGALWASGLNAEQLEEIVMEYNNNRKKVFRLIMQFNLPKLSFFKNRRIRAFLEKYIADKTFQDLKIPFKVVACNLNKSQAFVFDSGSLIDAVMASIAIPGVFAPANINNNWIVDGGIIEPVPIGVLVKMGIKKTIAVNALPSPENRASNYEINKIFRPAILNIIVNSLQTMEYVLAETECQRADVIIRPQAIGIDWFEFFNVEVLIKNGEESAEKALTEIKELINE